MITVLSTVGKNSHTPDLQEINVCYYRANGP
jgi:hypothetical protein